MLQKRYRISEKNNFIRSIDSISKIFKLFNFKEKELWDQELAFGNDKKMLSAEL